MSSMSGIEYENLEHKYLETKSKLKKTMQYNERYNVQIQKLNKRLKQLESENKRLESQIEETRSKDHDMSESSDTSTQANLKQDNATMVDLVQSKNQQIRDLLKDLEDIENENLILKDKLAETKDQLSTATTEITSMTETFKRLEADIKNQQDTAQALTTENESLQTKCEMICKAKVDTENKLQKLEQEMKEKELQWNELLKDKDNRIEKLKTLLPLAEEEQQSIENKEEVKLDNEKMSEEKQLKIVLEETQSQLAVLKAEMQNCTAELRDSTNVINKLKSNKEALQNKIRQMDEKDKNMAKQLKKSHDRCQAMQIEIEFANKLTKMFESELSTIKSQMKENGQVEMAVKLEEIQGLKIEKFLHEKQIVGLVKDINKLQEMFNAMEIENTSLRKELGLSADDAVDIDLDFLTQSKKQTKLIEKLQLENKKMQEERITLKLEIRNLKQKIATSMEKTFNKKEAEVQNSDPIKENRSADIQALSEENEALRKGLHEILNSVQVRNETSPRELKSDILERLLKALDVKHISGWYHPAMRLQAELHSLEGVNSELREQLYQARTELDKYKTSTTPRIKKIKSPDLPLKEKIDDIPKGNPSGVLAEVLNGSSCLEELKINILKMFVKLKEDNVDVESKLSEELELVHRNINQLHKNCILEKDEMAKKLQAAENALTEQELGLVEADLPLDELKQLIAKERRKTVVCINQLMKKDSELAEAKMQWESMRQKLHTELQKYLRKIATMYAKRNWSSSKDLARVDAISYKEVQNLLNETIKKHRQLLHETEEMNNQHALELQILKQNEVDLVSENNQLKEKMEKYINALNQKHHKHDPNVLELSEKFAKSEVEALSQKNRADHTNNLYELVKEQLKKSEEKFVEFSKYGDGLLQKNSTLQERVASLEDQVALWIAPEQFKELEEKTDSLIKENEKLLLENSELLDNINKIKDDASRTICRNKEKEQELLGLKHEIIDLTATSEDKAMIDTLYSDLAKSRVEVREYQMQVEFLRREVSNWEGRYSKMSSELDSCRKHFDVERTVLDKKIRVLQDIVLKQRIQYHGFVPLTLQEHFMNKLLAFNKESHAQFLMHQKKQESPYFTNQHTEYLKKKVESQELEIAKLEAELFKACKLVDFQQEDREVRRKPILVRETVVHESLDPIGTHATVEEKPEKKMVILRNVESQTVFEVKEQENSELTALKIQLTSLQGQIAIKENQVMETIRLLSQKEKELAESRTKLRAAEDRVAMLENSLKNIQDRSKNLEEIPHNGAGGDGMRPRNNIVNEQIAMLQISLKSAQDRIKQKDSEIIKYQTLLKDDRDKHSLAAANLQKELLLLKKAFTAEQQRCVSLEQESVIFKQKSVAVEKYISQVRALEQHLADLHTQLTQSNVQLQNAHQEASRWRQMAQDRLIAMQELGKSLNEQHNKEMSSYKTDYEKLKELSEEESTVKQAEPKMTGYIDPDIRKLCREKDEKIAELSTKLKHVETELKCTKTAEPNEQSAKRKPDHRDVDILKSKCDALLKKEQLLKDEVKDLKEQLSKRSATSSARINKSERSVKDQLQKRVNSLEREVDNLNQKLAQEQLINEKHRMNAHEDFEKWKKQKYWQENCQKYKSKLEEREDEFQKLQQACISFRALVERLEREKINLENRIKALKTDHRRIVPNQEIALLKDENERLTCELATLQAKMDMRQQGAGVLSSAVMQEKLEAQERKIAILELSSKGSVEMRNELERMQTSLGSLQKANLCLEAENLELKLDLEKYSKETPRLQEQILHLENYIELLKSENQHHVSTSESPIVESNEDKKVSQLERTVFVLKRVVEKLQVENKRLTGGKTPLPERSSSADKLRRDNIRLKEQYTESLKKLKDLETQLQVAKKMQRSQMNNELTEHLRAQLEEVKGQLLQKTQLLDKVKVLLHTAANREKQLLAEIAELKGSQQSERECQVDIPSTIEEVSEVSSEG